MDRFTSGSASGIEAADVVGVLWVAGAEGRDSVERRAGSRTYTIRVFSGAGGG